MLSSKARRRIWHPDHPIHFGASITRSSGCKFFALTLAAFSADRRSLADRLGRKKFLISGHHLFGLASVACGLARQSTSC